MNTMNIPGYTAEASLCKTSGRYGYSLRAFAQANTGVIPSLIRRCGPCYRDDTGACVRDCTNPCPPGHLPNGCGGTDTIPCAPSQCSPLPPPCCPAGCQGVC